MKKTIVLYSLAIAGAAILLQWLDFQPAVQTMSTPVDVVVIAPLLTALGSCEPATDRRPGSGTGRPADRLHLGGGRDASAQAPGVACQVADGLQDQARPAELLGCSCGC